MALIKCPECGKEISNKAEIYINCSFPLKQHKNNEMSAKKSKFYKSYKQENKNDKGWERPKEPEITDIKKLFLRNSVERSQNTRFNGIYKYTLFREKKEIYCPRCESENCSHYTKQKFVPGKTKTRYTANLNPFKPFTLVNKKKKILRKDQTYEINKIIYNNCGYTFI
jgi:DNA-directed RNA polymerase subunit RPC12/RpoP